MTKRVSAFIDGFNLYHSIDHLRQDHLKWLNLFRLCQHFAPAPALELRSVYYFSAYATWRPGPYKRHRQFVRALEAVGVRPILGNFKEKDRKCFGCNRSWKAREEKETDVNIALHLIMNAVRENCRKMKLYHLERSLLPREVRDKRGNVVAVRPTKYDPPNRF